MEIVLNNGTVEYVKDGEILEVNESDENVTEKQLHFIDNEDKVYSFKEKDIKEIRQDRDHMNKLKITYKKDDKVSETYMGFDEGDNLDIVTAFSMFLDVMEDAEFQFDREKVLESLRSDKTRFEVN